MTLDDFNKTSLNDALHTLQSCCAARRWAEHVAILRPYEDLDELLDSADSAWQQMKESDWLEAFAAHPQIGNVDTLQKKYDHTKALASNEQALVEQANTQVLDELLDKNQQYFKKFGFIFIVFASGKSAEQMLALLTARLPNDRQTELANAAAEQHRITRLRLEKLFAHTHSVTGAQ